MDVLTATPMALTDKNLYAYCDKNPIVRVDSNGKFWHIIIGAAIGAVSSITAQVISGQDINWTKVGISAASGAISGAKCCFARNGSCSNRFSAGYCRCCNICSNRKICIWEKPLSLSGILTAGVTSGVLAGGTKALGQYASSKYLDNVVKNSQKIQGQSLAKIKYAAELSPQWETGVLTKGNHAGMGWKATSHGDWLIQWHPCSQWHFNGSPHWKVSSGINGILRFPY